MYSSIFGVLDNSDTGTNSDMDGVTDAVSATDTDATTGTNATAGTDAATDTNATAGTDAATNTDVATDTAAATDTEVDPNEPVVFLRYTFTDGLEGFFAEGFSHNAELGYAEANLTIDGDQEYNVRKPVGPVDWSDITDINVVAKVEGGSVGGVQIYLQSGVDRDWCSQWFDLPNVQTWSTITMDGDYCANATENYMSMIHTVGFQIRTQASPGVIQNIHVQIDEIYVRRPPPPATDTVTATDTAQATDTAADTEMDASVDGG